MDCPERVAGRRPAQQRGMTGGGRRVAPPMDTIRALVADPGAPGRIAMRAVPAPEPAPTEAVVAVEAFSLNGGEVRALGQAADGWRRGWDLAGVVVQEAADSTGPASGRRVVGLAAGGSWA